MGTKQKLQKYKEDAGQARNKIGNNVEKSLYILSTGERYFTYCRGDLITYFRRVVAGRYR